MDLQRCDRPLHITRNKQNVTGVGFGSTSEFILDLNLSQVC
ncbi:hypothetical protein [Nostoc sp.]